MQLSRRINTSYIRHVAETEASVNTVDFSNLLSSLGWGLSYPSSQIISKYRCVLGPRRLDPNQRYCTIWVDANVVPMRAVQPNQIQPTLNLQYYAIPRQRAINLY
jgi:hypothetical protein